MGLQTWQEQLKGTTKYNLAKRVSKAVDKLRDAVIKVRLQTWDSAELQDALKEANLEAKLSDTYYEAKSTDAIFRHRWKEVSATSQDLMEEAFEVEALWGQHERETIMSLLKIISSLNEDFSLYIHHLYNPVGIFNAEQAIHLRKRCYRMTSDEEEDEFTFELSSKINSIKKFTNPYLTK